MLIIEIAKYLDAQGIGKYSEVDDTGTIFIDGLPAYPNDVISLYHRGGAGSDAKLGYGNQNIQIIVRAVFKVSALTQAQQIYDALHGFHMGQFVAGGVHIVGCQGIQSGVNYLNTDDKNRHEYSLNFEVEYKK